jgi:hypothetical protein
VSALAWEHRQKYMTALQQLRNAAETETDKAQMGEPPTQRFSKNLVRAEEARIAYLTELAKAEGWVDV